LLQPVMIDGRRLPGPSLHETRARAAANLAALPARIRDLGQAAPYPVEIGEDLLRLTEQVDARLAQAGP
jgi:nicotinate phosphoribosyltransferase